MFNNTLYVVVPLYDEQDLILFNLNSFLKQTDSNFKLILVDNNSTDNSVKVINKFANLHKEIFIDVIHEETKGTGAACDTGFSYAIKNGANYIARIDADSSASRKWVERIRKYFIKDHYEFIGGFVLPQQDKYFKWRDIPFAFGNDIGATSALKTQYRGKQYKYSYKYIVGVCMAITKDLYIKTGGFPRTRIEDVHEDFELSQKVRLITKNVKKSYFLITYHSMRRMRVYGNKKFKAYYSRKWKTDNADVR